MEQNLSLYEDKLQFYMVRTTEDNQLSSHMQFAREVFRIFFLITFRRIFFNFEDSYALNSKLE